MNSMTTDELKDWARKAKRKKGNSLSEEALQSIYA
jgi:hypothetical protein